MLYVDAEGFGANQIVKLVYKIIVSNNCMFLVPDGKKANFWPRKRFLAYTGDVMSQMFILFFFFDNYCAISMKIVQFCRCFAIIVQ